MDKTVITLANRGSAELVKADLKEIDIDSWVVEKTKVFKVLVNESNYLDAVKHLLLREWK